VGTEIALIFGSSPCGSWEFLQPYRGAAHVVCADGGLLMAEEAGFRPDEYVGDSDSGGAPREGLPAILLPPEKNLTDLQAAYERTRDEGYREIVLTACTGGRQDHHIANLQLLETARRDGIRARILDPWNEILFLEEESITFRCDGFRYFSLLPADRELRGVTITGAKYPLENVVVHRGDSLTVSNESLGGDVSVTIGRGSAWLILAGRK